jgi:acetoin utilization deacetylase AcuC-like enzyme
MGERSAATGIVRDARFLDHNYGAGHIEGPERLESIYAMIRAEHGLPLTIIEPRPATIAEIEYIHTPEYAAFISRTAGKRYLKLDPDTTVTAKSFETALLAAGGTMKAAETILAGELQNGFSLVRPPGHHAEKYCARGFCLFNNIAVTAARLIHDFGLRRVLIVDWDLHHGNGTQHAFYERSDVLYFSTHQFPYYPGSGYWDETGAGPGEGFTVNVPLLAGKSDGDYLFVYRNILGPIARAFKPEFILVSAGFDIMDGDPLGGMQLSDAGIAALAAEIGGLARELCGGRLLFVLEGGYDLLNLASGVKQVLVQLSGAAPAPEVAAEISPAARLEISPAWDIHGARWPLVR